jgi:serine/threonine protein kinase
VAPQVIGATLDHRYRVAEPVSVGAMGGVYRGVDLETKSEVVLKQSLVRHDRRRFEVEARLLSSLRHPRLARVVDHFQDDAAQYLVMEAVRGVDLAQVLRQQGEPGLPVGEGITWVTQACAALRYMHEQQVLHLGFKPQNMILTDDGVVLVDLAVAPTALDDQAGGMPGIGTPRFLAPEQFAGGHLSPRTDVFGVAVALWTLIAGRPPAYAEPIRLSTVCEAVAPDLARAIEAGLEMIPERRPASIAAYLDGLGVRPDDHLGTSLACTIDDPDGRPNLLEAIASAAAGVFGAATASLAVVDATTRELVYQAAWGAGAREIVGVRLPPGAGLAGLAVEKGAAEAVLDCRGDPRFAARIAAGTGYVPHTMLLVPLRRSGRPFGVLTLLDRRDGRGYGVDDVGRAESFAALASEALDTVPAL